MRYKLHAFNMWELGKRANQEDSLFPAFGECKDSDRLFIVCDGMGGHDSGEVASAAVCEAMSRTIIGEDDDAEGAFTDGDFQRALAAAFDALDAKDTGAEKKMGTTMTFLKLHNDGATIAHIGDSRVYHIRSGRDEYTTRILFQTRDHSLVNDLIKIGELTPEEAKHSRQKNVITRAMQPNMEYRPRADIYHTSDIRPGDYFMLCSDGVLEELEDENFQYLFSPKGVDDDNRLKMLVRMTQEHKDNHTAIIVHILDVEGIVAPDEEPVSSDPEVDSDVLEEVVLEEVEEVEQDDNHKIQNVDFGTAPRTELPIPVKDEVIDTIENRKESWLDIKNNRLKIGPLRMQLSIVLMVLVLIAVVVILCVMVDRIFPDKTQKGNVERVEKSGGNADLSKELESLKSVVDGGHGTAGAVSEVDADNPAAVVEWTDSGVSAVEPIEESGPGIADIIKAGQEHSTQSGESSEVVTQDGNVVNSESQNITDAATRIIDNGGN